MRTETINIYTFDELSVAAKEKALETYRDWNVDGFDWWDCVYDDAKHIAALMGMDIKDIWFSGFWSQGDGASFTGRYGHRPGSVKAVMAYAPQDTELHEIAKDLQAVQRENFYQLYASVETRGSYSHSGTMQVTVERESPTYQPPTSDAEERIRDPLCRLADWIYGRLEEEHEYQTSDDSVADSFRANEMEFTEGGSFY